MMRDRDGRGERGRDGGGRCWVVGCWAWGMLPGIVRHMLLAMEIPDKDILLKKIVFY